MNEKLEQVARALAKRHYESRFGTSNPVHVQRNVDGNWNIFVDDARAAIVAMREPTEAMLDYRDALVKRSDALIVWQHQIDEALR